MKRVFAIVLMAAALSSPASAAAVLAPVMDDGGSAGTTCRWNPYARIACGPADCWWLGQFQWHDPYGYPTGVACA